MKIFQALLCVAGADLAVPGIPVTLEKIDFGNRVARQVAAGSGDIDECDIGTDNCDVNAVCTDLAEDFSCECNAGYYGDGTVCTVKQTINAAMTMPLNEPYSADLADPTTPAYKALAAKVVGQCEAAIAATAAELGMDHSINGCTFSATQRRRRQAGGGTGGGTAAEVDISLTSTGAPADPNANLADTVSASVAANVNDAIASGSIALVDPDATIGITAAEIERWNYFDSGVDCSEGNTIYGSDSSHCGNNGYCCMGNPSNLPVFNGDCPADALALAQSMFANDPASIEVTINGVAVIHQCFVETVNECVESSPCHADATCTDTADSFECACGAGYTGDGVTTCSNIDECADNQCQFGHCSDSTGGYTCDCWGGFVLSTDAMPKCIDFNECAAGGTICHSQAMCINTLGSYACMCNSGYVGDGLSCRKKSIFWFFG